MTIYHYIAPFNIRYNPITQQKEVISYSSNSDKYIPTNRSHYRGYFRYSNTALMQKRKEEIEKCGGWVFDDGDERDRMWEKLLDEGVISASSIASSLPIVREED